jgi:hypothetical protein
MQTFAIYFRTNIGENNEYKNSTRNLSGKLFETHKIPQVRK